MAALDIEDFKSIVVGSDTVDFRVHSGDDLTKTANEICEVLSECTHALCIITTNGLTYDCEEI